MNKALRKTGRLSWQEALRDAPDELIVTHTLGDPNSRVGRHQTQVSATGRITLTWECFGRVATGEAQCHPDDSRRLIAILAKINFPFIDPEPPASGLSSRHIHVECGSLTGDAMFSVDKHWDLRPHANMFQMFSSLYCRFRELDDSHPTAFKRPVEILHKLTSVEE